MLSTVRTDVTAQPIKGVCVYSIVEKFLYQHVLILWLLVCDFAFADNKYWLYFQKLIFINVLHFASCMKITTVHTWYTTCVSIFFVNGDKVITLEPTCIYSECVYDKGVDNDFFYRWCW